MRPFDTLMEAAEHREGDELPSEAFRGTGLLMDPLVRARRLVQTARLVKRVGCPAPAVRAPSRLLRHSCASTRSTRSSRYSSSAAPCPPSSPSCHGAMAAGGAPMRSQGREAAVLRRRVGERALQVESFSDESLHVLEIPKLGSLSRRRACSRDLWPCLPRSAPPQVHLTGALRADGITPTRIDEGHLPASRTSSDKARLLCWTATRADF